MLKPRKWTTLPIEGNEEYIDEIEQRRRQGAYEAPIGLIRYAREQWDEYTDAERNNASVERGRKGSVRADSMDSRQPSHIGGYSEQMASEIPDRTQGRDRTDDQTQTDDVNGGVVGEAQMSLFGGEQGDLFGKKICGLMPTHILCRHLRWLMLVQRTPPISRLNTLSLAKTLQRYQHFLR